MGQHSQLDLCSMAVTSFLPHPTHLYLSQFRSIKVILQHNYTGFLGKHEHAARRFVPTAGTRSLLPPLSLGDVHTTSLRNSWQRRRPQVDKRALIASTVGGPLSLSILYSVMASPPCSIIILLVWRCKRERERERVCQEENGLDKRRLHQHQYM